METYRIRASSALAPRKLLLPLSFGPSSATLLHILDHHLETQYKRMNRAAYELLVVHIDLFLEANDRERSARRLEQYKQRFPRHSYSSLGLEEAPSLDGIDWQAFDLTPPAGESQESSSTKRLQEILGSVDSATARADIASTLLTRLLVDVGKKSGCESILFGDSTTRIAERTLAETAKGRGFSLPWQVSDGKSPYGIGFNFPLRDLLKKEIVAFTHLTSPSLTDLVVYQESQSTLSASAKTTTIDDLMAQYFETVEENYPSIVANVVRTTSKLKPSSSDATSCTFCGLPVAEGTDGTAGWGGDQSLSTRSKVQDGSDNILCYGCARSING